MAIADDYSRPALEYIYPRTDEPEYQGHEE